MGNLSVQEKLKTISMLIQKHKDLQAPLELQKKILQIQLEIDNTPTKGTTTNWDNPAIVSSFLQKAMETKKPIIHFLEPSSFNLATLKPMLKKTAQVFIDQKIDEKGVRKFLNLADEGKVNLSQLIRAALEEDLAPIKKTAEDSDLPPARLLYMLSVLIQPCLEEIVRKIDPSMLDKWWQSHCPVCGRTPIVAKPRQRKRYLVCTFCGAEYLSDSFLCVHCGNRDPYTLKYLSIETQPAFQVDFCTKCRHYVKVIEETGLKETIPKGFEDILTLELDVAAKKANLERE